MPPASPTARLLSQAKPVAERLITFLLPFDTSVWVTLLITIILCGVLLWVFESKEGQEEYQPRVFSSKFNELSDRLGQSMYRRVGVRASACLRKE